MINQVLEDVAVSYADPKYKGQKMGMELEDLKRSREE